MFSDVKFAIYLTKIKSEKSTFVFKSTENKKPCRQKLLSDKQMKFKEYSACPDSFKIFFFKNVVLYEICSVK